MYIAKEQARKLVDSRKTTYFAFISSLAILIPFFIHNQWITGPMVNALLILILFFVGIRSALILCVIPSMMALAGGLLPAVMAPVLPFIILGNMIYVVTIDCFYSRIKDNMNGYWIGVVVGSLLKYLLLYFSTNLVMNLILNKVLAEKVAMMFSWNQLATALLGGLIAWTLLKMIKRV